MCGPDAVEKKVVVVGDGDCGKTSMLRAFTDGDFPLDGSAALLNTSTATMKVGCTKVRLSLWDAAGQDEYDQQRTSTYTGADVVIVVFSVDAPVSLTNVEAMWWPEVKHFCFEAPLLLVGNKKDLRNSPESAELPVSYEEAQETARAIRADDYLECSALTKEGIDQVFQEAARLAMRKKTGFKFLCRTCCNCL